VKGTPLKENKELRQKLKQEVRHTNFYIKQLHATAENLARLTASHAEACALLTEIMDCKSRVPETLRKAVRDFLEKSAT
jgi:hypothetical protein